jgi:hypothetical protein
MEKIKHGQVEREPTGAKHSHHASDGSGSKF